MGWGVPLLVEAQCASGRERHSAFYFPGQVQGKHIRGIQDVEVEHIAFLRAHAPFPGAGAAGLGAVDGLAVDVHPGADGGEALERLLRQRAVGARPYVEQEIGA